MLEKFSEGRVQFACRFHLKCPISSNLSSADDLDVLIQGLLTLSVTLPPGVLITDSHSSPSGTALTPDRVVLQGLSCRNHDCYRTHFKAPGLAGRCIGVCMQIDMIGGCRPGLNFSLKVQKETLQTDIASDNCCKLTTRALNKNKKIYIYFLIFWDCGLLKMHLGNICVHTKQKKNKKHFIASFVGMAEFGNSLS